MYTYQITNSLLKIPQENKYGEVEFNRIRLKKINLFLTQGETNFVTPLEVQITQVRRRGEITYSIKGLFKPTQPKFRTLILDSRLKLQPRWKQLEHGLTYEKMKNWLSSRLGEKEAEKAINQVF